MLTVDKHQIDWTPGVGSTNYVTFTQERDVIYVAAGDDDGTAQIEMQPDEAADFLVALQAWIEAR